MAGLVAVFILVVCSTLLTESESKMSNRSALLQNLLDEYGPSTIRPVHNISNKITVEFRLLITQVIELNEKHQTIQISGWLRQTWNDEFLMWNPDEYGGVQSLFVHKSRIWLPDTTLYKNVDRDFESYKDISAEARYDGQVTWSSPVILKCTCLIDARLFPFDTQVCDLKFSSWAFDGSAVDLVMSTGAKALQDQFADTGVWELLKVDVVRFETWYTCCPHPYPELTYSLHLRRRPLFHVLNIILPCLLLSILNLMVFGLPPESGEKIQLGMTNLLALVLFQQLISESLPPTSENSPIIGFYFTPMIAIGCTSIVCTVLVLNLFYHDNRHPIPRWLRWLSLKLAVILFYQVKRQPVVVNGTCNPAFRLDNESTNQGFTESDSGRLTASCSFTDSSSSTNGDGTVSQSENTPNGDGQKNCKSRCRAYSMHIMQEVYSNGNDPVQIKASGTVARKAARANKRKPDPPRGVILEWKDVALIIDRFTMVLSVLITGTAMAVTIYFFAMEI
ncbi:neuronal acetylcholine receptor subunit alpha-9-like [Asterias rubens]|uniref:neuronal acetylcholine receptor subunit alpha-9-like n=1 Tax=Asterias rubens TaxID=7604 RepID=UPI00145574F3|nr:neuronal acetylcholine receptor subunit alpha-9-like [Asterias rubens]